MKDYYKILGVDPKATIEQIKFQYRLLIHAWHPDKFPNGELKKKAEEKIKEINEAFSVIGDPVKRENYDRVLRSYSPSSPSSQQTYSSPAAQSRQTQSSAQAQKRCESCGLPVEIKYVNFHENVGMIIMRLHRSVKGEFCKSCIDYYFWNFTGKTMLLGWWGIISFIVTPFILLNNFFFFVFTMGMKKNPLSITPNPLPFWVFTTIGGIFITGFFLFSTFCSDLTLPVSSLYSPTSTVRVVAPTRVPTTVNTPTSTALPTATPTPTKLPTATSLPRRLKNGTFIKRAVPLDGYGKLEIDNGTDLDAAAVLTTRGEEIVFSVYIRAHSKVTITGIRDGTYKLFFMMGEDWDNAVGRFTRKTSYQVFEDTFPYTTTATKATIWYVTLHPVVGGTAETEHVDPNEFPSVK